MVLHHPAVACVLATLSARELAERYATCCPFTGDYGAFINALPKGDAGRQELQARCRRFAVAGKSRAADRQLAGGQAVSQRKSCMRM